MAAEGVLFQGWNRPVAGREGPAVELFNQFLGYWAARQAAGEIDSFEPVLLRVHGGDLNGFVLVRGEAAKLAALTDSEEFKNLEMRVSVNVDGFGTIAGWTGQGVASQMARYVRAIAK